MRPPLHPLQVVLDGSGHQPLVPEHLLGAEEARRGPGMYLGAERIGEIGTEGPFWNFAQ